ncbi:L,D-transpeptidase family protein [Ferruginivarius sediminum]|nr:L,D-transpeptidase family protein [Ferruginivarius sediminum]
MPIAFKGFRILAAAFIGMLQLAACASAEPPKDPPAEESSAEALGIVGGMASTTTAYEDTLLDVAYRHGVGFVELVAANPGVDPWLPGEGTRVVLPKQHILPDAPQEGIVVNLAEMRIYYYPPDGAAVQTYPVGIGRSGKSTPLGLTKVASKRKDPIWYPTEATRKDNPELPKVVPAGPENPLGAHALDLGWPAYLIHGTNNVWGIGRRVSRGCIRMYPEDIERLFAQVKPGTPTNVVDQPIKFAWMDGALYMEAHTTQAQAEQLEESGSFEPDEDLQLARLVGRALGGRLVPLDWQLIEKTAAERRGVPVKVSE